MINSSHWSLAADPSRRIGQTVEFHSTIGSTNDRARELLRLANGASPAVVADFQTAGRGRRGRTWLSPPGRNLMVSVGHRTRLGTFHAWQLAAAAALAVREACSTWAALSVAWPNDVAARDGRKVAGLLIETSVDGSELIEAVLGVGINVNWRRAEMPSPIAERATSLADLANREIDRVELLRRVLDALDAELTKVTDGTSPLPRYRAASALDGQRVEVLVADERFVGRVAGIGDDGSLLLRTAEGERVLAYGEVIRVEHEVAAQQIVERSA